MKLLLSFANNYAKDLQLNEQLRNSVLLSQAPMSDRHMNSAALATVSDCALIVGVGRFADSSMDLPGIDAPPLHRGQNPHRRRFTYPLAAAVEASNFTEAELAHDLKPAHAR